MCRAWPDISVGDAELAGELRRRGYKVDAEPWNDAPISVFTSADRQWFRHGLFAEVRE